jgi:hypothetical protein
MTERRKHQPYGAPWRKMRAEALTASWHLRYDLWAATGQHDRLTEHQLFPWQPVEQWCQQHIRPDVDDNGILKENTARQIGTASGHHHDTIWRYRRRGWLTEPQADRLAIGFGLHPLAFWPNFYSLEVVA